MSKLPGNGLSGCSSSQAAGTASLLATRASAVRPIRGRDETTTSIKVDDRGPLRVI